MNEWCSAGQGIDEIVAKQTVGRTRAPAPPMGSENHSYTINLCLQLCISSATHRCDIV